MNAVGIDVSKRKSTITIRRPGDVIVMDPCDIPHTKSSINELINIIKSLDGETKGCMEHTGRYYEPIASRLSSADIFVSAVNPILIRNFGSEVFVTPKPIKQILKKSPVSHLTAGTNCLNMVLWMKHAINSKP